ncbi:tagatose-bisphosphate aldolase [Erysipelothrix rhusiopathiae]|uniref:class II D-tagatose-bisphosphate aldolase, non-catalytic subunit n=1 Tax=unclassified Erysipelothrix TaxID=2624170 RepID=UPI0013766B1A|nr:class II D-tagatose-bisphosphate aldolase, non-catalytic subunit [Erysipelothrix sp. strain 2 (EsS2-7-Brazil)]MBK2403623.1 tagatose-bisphosphate aldolase [Erysipelothrix sp. strain 2 (EsS2-7-Brazil)]NBA01361.1 tagatose-bisphosphate aldolase [Erysipelothrix rhusiopathiae]
MKKNPLFLLNNKRPVGVYSACTASGPVLEATLEFAKEHNSSVVIEATANQVNQFGGYTGMQPADFKAFVYELSDKVGYDKSRIILGGDHLGPLTWTDLNEDEAMKNACDLVYAYVRAGFTKIHLDTSMRVADDSTEEVLSNETIARRSAMMAKVCLEAYDDLLKEDPEAVFPAFIIGSEVPIPGGAQEEEDTLAVTSPEAFKETYRVFQETFKAANVEKVFDSVIGIVVQPGVEFGDADLFQYNRENAKELTDTLKREFDSFVFEGHSTDYQTPTHLREMVEDGITILKVGPALTFAYREALFALAHIESQICTDPSNFVDVLEAAMLDQPGNWQKHYHGTEAELFIKRKYSYSDRARYYLPVPSVQAAITKLVANLDAVEIPMTLISQYMPYQYRRIKDGIVENHADALIKDYIKLYLDDYQYATHVDELEA